MKIFIKSVALLLLTMGIACAETIADAEKSLLLEANNFKNHPLFMYLKPEGYKALDYALHDFPKSCLNDKNIEKDVCIQKRIILVNNLTEKFNFKNISVNDFKDKNLWLLSENLKKLYKTKLDLLNKKMQSLKLSERMKLAGIIKELRKKESYLTNHFLKNKKGGKSTENGKSNQSNISNEIGLFKNHPLYHYMQLGGHQALSIALNFVEPLCRTTDFINTDKCKLERQQLVNNLKDKGFSNLSVNDFKDDRLWKIQNNLRLLYIEKMRDINANVRNTPIKERWDAKQPARELRAKLKSLTEQLVQNRIQ